MSARFHFFVPPTDMPLDKTPRQHLPTALLALIFTFLDFMDVARVVIHVSRHWRAAPKNLTTWPCLSPRKFLGALSVFNPVMGELLLDLANDTTPLPLLVSGLDKCAKLAKLNIYADQGRDASKLVGSLTSASLHTLIYEGCTGWSWRPELFAWTNTNLTSLLDLTLLKVALPCRALALLHSLQKLTLMTCDCSAEGSLPSSLESLSIHKNMGQVEEELIRVCGTVKHLSLSTCVGDVWQLTPSTLLRVCRSSPQMQTLWCQSVYLLDEDAEPLSLDIKAACSRLERLEFRSSNVYGFTKCFMSE